MITDKIDKFEGAAVDLVAKIAPWCAPIPTAYLVGRATVVHLHWPGWVGIVAAVIVETLGLASTSTALDLYQYNQSRRKSDPGAPFVLAAALVLVYFAVATGLTVLLDIFPSLAVYSPAIFPSLSLTGITVLALRSDHRRRLAVIQAERAEKKAERQARRLEMERREVSNPVKSDRLDKAREALRIKAESRLDTLLDAFSSNPDMSIAEAARLLNCTRQTVYSYVDTLEAAGRLSKNGHGWEVMQ